MRHPRGLPDFEVRVSKALLRFIDTNYEDTTTWPVIQNALY